MINLGSAAIGLMDNYQKYYDKGTTLTLTSQRSTFQQGERKIHLIKLLKRLNAVQLGPTKRVIQRCLHSTM